MGEREALLDNVSASPKGASPEVASAEDSPVDADPAREPDDAGPGVDHSVSAPSRRAGRVRRSLVGLAAISIAALGASTAVLLNQHLNSDAAQALQQRYLQSARQSVLDLTTISAATVDDDVARVLERSTGTFRDQFEQRSVDFVGVVQQADVNATGTITEAGIENSDDKSASVLVSATSTVTNSLGAQDEPRVWRLRIALENDGASILVSDVEFVP